MASILNQIHVMFSLEDKTAAVHVFIIITALVKLQTNCQVCYCSYHLSIGLSKTLVLNSVYNWV